MNVVGARPNLVKIAPLLREMRRHPEIEPVLVHTGQRYEEKLSDIFPRQMIIPEPETDANLGVGSGSHTLQTAEVMRRIEPVLLEHKLDRVLVVGDVNSTMAAVRYARLRSVPRQPKLQGKEHQENSRSTLPFPFSPCSLIRSTTGVSQMLARRAMRSPKNIVPFSNPTYNFCAR